MKGEKKPGKTVTIGSGRWRKNNTPGAPVSRKDVLDVFMKHDRSSQFG